MSRTFAVSPVETGGTFSIPDAASLPRVTVNILSYNRVKELRINLGKITATLDYPKEKLEVVVVDNASTDGTAAMVRSEFPQVQFVETGRNEGIAGWNEGFRRGTGDYFLVLDDDCYMEGDSLRQAVAEAERHGADIVSFRVVNPNEDGFIFNEHVNSGLLSFWGCAVLINRKTIEATRGFGAYFLCAELEFIIRAFDAGCSHLFLPGITAYHMKEPGSQTKRSLFSIKIFALNHGLLIGKLFHRSLVPRLVLYALGGYLRYDFRAPGVMLAEVISFFRGLAMGFRDRRPVSRETSEFFAHNHRNFRAPLFRFGKRRMEIERRFFTERESLFRLDRSAILRVVEK